MKKLLLLLTLLALTTPCQANDKPNIIQRTWTTITKPVFGDQSNKPQKVKKFKPQKAIEPTYY